MQRNQPLERAIVLEGAHNLRDLGGVPLPGGGQTRFGAFYRMDDPCGLTAADLARLDALGVRTVIDLRFAEEVARRPHPLAVAPGIRYENVPLGMAMFDTPENQAMLADMGAFYCYLLDHGGDSWRHIFRLALATDGAVLFHCTAGKDRTGVMALLLLSLAGAADEEIVADYELTEATVLPRIAQLLPICPPGFPVAHFERALHAYPESIRAALQHLHAAYGDAATYLAAQGLTAAELAALKARLV